MTFQNLMLMKRQQKKNYFNYSHLIKYARDAKKVTTWMKMYAKNVQLYLLCV